MSVNLPAAIATDGVNSTGAVDRQSGANQTMPSFDIVSEVDKHELTNAVDQAHREITNRFDFKGSNASIELKDEKVELTADSDFQVQQMHTVLYQKLTTRKIDISSLDPEKIEKVGKGARQYMAVKQGIDKETAKKIAAKVKESKLKVQAAIQGESLRVTGKKRDDLQSTMAMLKKLDLGLPLQFQNFRD